MTEVKQAILKFDLSDKLPLRYGHKLRGFFANRFEEVLFHNHKEDGSYRYAYPLIQYKIIAGLPTIIGLEEGANLITNKFLDIEKLVLAGEEYIEPEGRLEIVDQELEVVTDIAMPKFEYQFYAPWVGLNQRNYKRYIEEIRDKSSKKQRDFFAKILIGNILTYAKGVDWWIEEEIEVVPDLEEVEVQFKNKKMIGFVGKFYSNISLPEYIGLGKSVARGFGTLQKKELV